MRSGRRSARARGLEADSSAVMRGIAATALPSPDDEFVANVEAWADTGDPFDRTIDPVVDECDRYAAARQ